MSDPTYLFEKSGSEVRIVGPTESYLGQKGVIVARVDSGKEMIVPRSSLKKVVPPKVPPKGVVDLLRGMAEQCSDRTHPVAGVVAVDVGTEQVDVLQRQHI